MNKSFQGIALVTGSATGVGRSCALRFAGLGYDVVVTYPKFDETEAQETARLIEDKGRRAILVECDVSQDSQVVELLAKVASQFGQLDLVVNCAGVTHFVEPADLDSMSEEKWDEILAVNTKGPFFVIRAAVPLLSKSDHAAVVNVSSVAGISGFGSSLAYCASKGALNTMTKSLARALAPKIRVNAVCPGPIDSRWLRQSLSDEEMEERVASFPIPRLSTPDDITDAIVYLATGNAMVTGQLQIVDGGRTM